MAPNTLRAAIAGTEALTTLADLLAATSLDELLDEPGPFTIFAPTDAAFAKLAPADLAALRAELPRLRAALSDHLVPGTLVAADLMALRALTTLSGEDTAVSDAKLGFDLHASPAPPGGQPWPPGGGYARAGPRCLSCRRDVYCAYDDRTA